MKIIGILILFVVSIVIVLLITALFVKNEYKVEREIVINKPQQQVFDYIKLLKNQDHYNKWVMMDPNLQKDFRGTDGTVGFVYAWNGNKQAGQGEQQIKRISDRQIDIQLRFIKPFEGIANTSLSTNTLSSQQTKVKWEMSGRNPFPMNLMNLLMNKTLGESLDESLGNLKTVLENQ
ncbi:SRPBCC family protein [Solitalea sp. MAHUQ-68]|uniref:SRPBCC family protein n=1 Tax=Solitalea agri TaxID=2953739 RepID=A0A9X2F321_9SPHI|nr:SRPBCC family protein [Solitalea agri]MCO4293325.1 SRPBCC family protein [Solitalea agri]